jgi:murein DD-endopeptidase MepM/ murein hydrolase activator NlpD
MAHGFTSYSKPDIGNLGKYLGDKIKSAAAMAAGERKYAKEQEEKQRKEGVPEEEIKKNSKGHFFGKALSHEFGGDLFRRTKGTFSRDPSEQEDPSLTKAQRFSALVRGDVLSPSPFKQLELPLDNGSTQKTAVQVEDKGLKSWLTVAFDKIQKSYDNIGDKIAGLQFEEDKQSDQEIKNTKTITKIISGLQTVKSFFNKNNKLQEEENKIESEQLEFNLDAQNNEEMRRREADIERGQDLSSTSAYSDPYAQGGEDEKDSKNRSFIDRILDFDMDRRGRRRKKGFKRRYATKKLGGFRRIAGRKFGGAGRAFASASASMPRIPLSSGGVIAPQNESQKQINPSTPSNISTKLSGGGIVDNPTKTTLNPGQSVIPLNRNNPMKQMFQQMGSQNKQGKTGKTMSEDLGAALQLPAQAAGGLLISTMAGVFKRLGGVGQMFAPFFNQLFNPLARVFGLPANVIGSVLGGQPAAAATLDMKDIGEFFTGSGKKSKKKGTSGGGGGTTPTTPYIPGGAETQYNITGGQKITRSMFGSRGFGTKDGLGSGATAFGHTGRDVGLSEGTPLSLVSPGTVVEASTGHNGGYGNFVVVKLDDGRYIKSNHHKRNLVRKGDRVGMQADGSVKAFAEVGSTGLSTGPHLHLDLGTGYSPGSGSITGLMDPDNFILGGGLVTGGQVKASSSGNVAGSTPPAISPTTGSLNANTPSGISRSPSAITPTPAGAVAKPAGGSSNLFLNMGSTATPQQSNPYISNNNFLTLPTTNPVSPTYSTNW